MSSKYSLRYLKEDEYDNWDKMVFGSEYGSIYNRADYLDILCQSAGGSFSILAVEKGGQLHGGVALYKQKAWHGLVISNRLLLYYNGIILFDHKTKYPSDKTSRNISILSALKKEFENLPVSRVLLHCRKMTDLRPYISGGWFVLPRYSYEVNISDLDKTWQKIDQNQRRLISRCENEQIMMSNDDDFESFFSIHYETHQRKGAPLYLPKENYRKYFKLLYDSKLARMYHARTKDGESVASQLVLLGHPTTHTVCAGANGDYLKVGVNPFLRWHTFKSLSNDGYIGNDLTDATLSPVTRFKSQLGGDLCMNLVIQKFDSLGFRFDRSLNKWKWKLRGGLSNIYHRMIPRK